MSLRNLSGDHIAGRPVGGMIKAAAVGRPPARLEGRRPVGVEAPVRSDARSRIWPCKTLLFSADIGFAHGNRESRSSTYNYTRRERARKRNRQTRQIRCFSCTKPGIDRLSAGRVSMAIYRTGTGGTLPRARNPSRRSSDRQTLLSVFL